MKSQKISNIKPIVSVKELVENIGISRARFYQLQQQGFFPHAIYDIRTHRPYFDERLQMLCYEIKDTGIGVNGQINIFYSPRKGTTKKTKQKKFINPIYKDFAESLNAMGLSCSPKDVQTAAIELYPNGIEEFDHGLVIREIYRSLKSN